MGVSVSALTMAAEGKRAVRPIHPWTVLMDDTYSFLLLVLFMLPGFYYDYWQFAGQTIETPTENNEI